MAMTNEELAGALDQVRRLIREVSRLNTSTVDLAALCDLKDIAEELLHDVKGIISQATDEQDPLKGVEFVNFSGFLSKIIAIRCAGGEILHAIEFVAQDGRDTVGLPLIAEGLTAADPADFEWDEWVNRWRLKPSGKTNV